MFSPTLSSQGIDVVYVGICCSHSPVGCPPANTPGPCVIECSSNSDCSDDRICCTNGCGGQVCTHPTGLVCSPFVRVTPSCEFECNGDRDCGDGQFCCATACGGTTCSPYVQADNYCNVSNRAI